VKELNLTIYTGSDNGNKVTLTAAFASHEDAVRFHDGLARLCREHSPGAGSMSGWGKRMLLLPKDG
jgi:hypothetical protein